MDFWKHFPVTIIVILAILAVYGVSGLVRNGFEIASLEFKGAAWPLDTSPINLVFMLTQPLLTLGAVIGIVGTVKKDAIMIYCTSFVLVGVFVPYLLFGVFAVKESIAVASNNNNALSHVLFKTVRNNVLFNEWLTDFQYENQCCGVYSYMDWKMFNISSPELPLPPNSVPTTCCSHRARVPPPDCGVNILHENQPVETIRAVLFTEGCGAKLSQIFSQRLLEHGVEMIAIGFICLLIAVFIYFGISKNYTLVTFGDNVNGHNGRGNMRLVANNDPAYLARNRGRGIAVRRMADAGDCGVDIESLECGIGAGGGRKRQQRRSSGPVKKFGPSPKQRRLNSQALQAQAQGCNPSPRPPDSQPMKSSSHNHSHQDEDEYMSAVQTEMLFQPASDKYSIQSTCPYSSTSQNLWFKKGPSGNPDSHSNKPSITNPSTVNATGPSKEKDKGTGGFGAQLTYYSSLPQVQIKTPPGSHHHHLRSWVCKPHVPRAAPDARGVAEAGGNANVGPAPFAPCPAPETQQSQSNNITVPLRVSVSACETPELLPPITVGVNNGNLLIMESHEKLITTTPTDSDYLDDDSQESVARTIAENVAGLLEAIESKPNLDVIVEEDGTGVDSSTEVTDAGSATVNDENDNSDSEALRPIPNTVVTFDDEVVQAIEYLNLDMHCVNGGSDTEGSPEQVQVLDA